MSWKEFVAAVAKTKSLKYPWMKQVIVSQAILESGRGTTPLSKKLNFNGMKYRESLVGFGGTKFKYYTDSEPRLPDGSQGWAYFFEFDDYEKSIKTWQGFFSRVEGTWVPYPLVRAEDPLVMKDPQSFLDYIGPIYCPYFNKATHGGLSYSQYIIEKLFPEAKSLLKEAGWDEDDGEIPSPTIPPQDYTRVLYRDSHGDDVLVIQQNLKESGFYAGSIDGIFGDKTLEAVIKFQSAKELYEGAVGPMTWAALVKKPEIPPTPPSENKPAYPGVVLRRGSQGDDVKLVQAKLASLGLTITVDGDFGPQTESVIMTFQHYMKIGVDGLVGPTTWAKLFSTSGPITTEDPIVIEPERPGAEEIGKKLLWIPWAKDAPSMNTQGYYPKGYPSGATVHFTAGSTGLSSMSYGRSQGYLFLLIDYNGDVYQPNALDKWGYHNGTDSHRRHVGIEVAAAGRCTPVTVNGTQRFKAWFHKSTTEYFYKEDMRYISAQTANQEPGWYHKYTKQQEDALTKLLLWLKANNPQVFSFDEVLGHDEVAPRRKNDPGGALSMTMPQYRKFLKDEYEKFLKE